MSLDIFLVWFEDQEVGQPVYTQNDLETYTHVLYLDFPANAVQQLRLSDTKRRRLIVSAAYLRKWQRTEISQLRNLCYRHGILFSLVSSLQLERVSKFLRDFRHHNDGDNLSRAKSRLDEILKEADDLEVVLVMNADRTLAEEDTGAFFWKMFSTVGYSYTSSRQAVLLYEETAGDEDFNAMCQGMASMVPVHP